jgi:excinuclease ABC subunit C
MPNRLINKIKNLPQKPGVYLFKDKTGQIIYIGKAKNLRSRVRQYFQGTDERPQIPYLLKEIFDVDIAITRSELESLYLENSLIKQHLPKYNIELRDDKNFAFIKIDYSTEIPQIVTVRKIESRPETTNSNRMTRKKNNSGHSGAIRGLGSRYFGPYSAAYKINNTLTFIRKIFPYCSATKISVRPCFYFHLHRCPGVCIEKISLGDYKKQLDKIAYFLAGNTAKVKAELKKEMLAASKAKKFEAAARCRDQLRSLEMLEEKQTAILTKKVDWDVVSISSSIFPSPWTGEGGRRPDEGEGLACINLFKIRQGKLLDKENFIYELTSPNLSLKKERNAAQIPLLNNHSALSSWPKREGQGEVLQKFLEQYYLETSSLPQTIYTQWPAKNQKLIEQIATTRFGKKIAIICPQKGKAKQLASLGQTNAEEYLKNYQNSKAKSLDKIQAALAELKKVLNLPQVPKRIEGYDISNLQGTNPVGSMVVFQEGLPAKSQYRKFKIKINDTPDDYAMMKEMLTRRFARSVPIYGRSREADESHRDLQPAHYTNAWSLPDLIVIDGGKGQLNAALEVLRKFSIFNFQFSIIGLAKRIEEIFVPGRSEPIILSHDNPALQLLQRLRDEAHRFGITFHRQLRSKQAVKSALDEIPGVGPKTKKLLKAKFGTVAEIKKADVKKLEILIGKKLAQKIKQLL